VSKVARGRERSTNECSFVAFASQRGSWCIDALKVSQTTPFAGSGTRMHEPAVASYASRRQPLVPSSENGEMLADDFDTFTTF
jgi:hypothetical protein